MLTVLCVLAVSVIADGERVLLCLEFYACSWRHAKPTSCLEKYNSKETKE